MRSTLPALFTKSTLKYPENEAADGTNYTQLHDITDRYVAGLKTAGVQKGDVVCLLFASKSVHAIALALAIMRVGATYVPLSSTFPGERLSTQCRAVGKAVKLLVHGEEEIDQNKAEAVGSELQVPVRSLDYIRSQYRNTSDMSSWEDLALILFTSGSSGPPKATGYKHKQLASSLETCAAAFGFSSTTRICNVVPYVWDAANLDAFGPLLRGGAVCFAHDLTPNGIAQTIIQKRCTWMASPPSLLRTIPIEALSKLEKLASAGESASPAQFREWSTQLALLSNTRLLNAYGLTESGIFNIAWECPTEFPEGLRSVPLGSPIGDNTVLVEEQTGQLVIVGQQVTEGYLGFESSTFIAPPSMFSNEHWAVRTGDLGWKDEKGRYHIEGRLDERISILSLRIEPAETESVAFKVPGIDFAHLFVHELGEGLTPSLVLAYHVSSVPLNEGFLSKDQYSQYADTYERQLREQMNQSVPEYQRPSAYLPLGSVLRTISQKKDTKRIAMLATELHEHGLVDLAPFEVSL
jgi:acyl-coenzyme A synthetase/AMP-(fatty) acid ligase